MLSEQNTYARESLSSQDYHYFLRDATLGESTTLQLLCGDNVLNTVKVLLKYNGNPFFCLLSDPLWSSSNECRENYSTTLSFSVQCWTEDWTCQGICSISELVIPKCIHSAEKRVSVLYYTSNEKEIWVQNIIAGKREFLDVFHVIIACAFTGCLVSSSLHLLHNNESKSRKHKRIKIVSFSSAGTYT